MKAMLWIGAALALLAVGCTNQTQKAITTKSGLQYVEIAEGTGPTPRHGQLIEVHYTGWLTNGSKFDSSRDKGKPYSLHLGMGEVIKGWDEALSTMKVGGKRKLTVPPDLAYGTRGASGMIPPGATLVFEVELVAIH